MVADRAIEIDGVLTVKPLRFALAMARVIHHKKPTGETLVMMYEHRPRTKWLKNEKLAQALNVKRMRPLPSIVLPMHRSE